MKIDFTYNQLAILDKAIQELPYRLAAPLIEYINKEIKRNEEEMNKVQEIKGVENGTN